MEPRPTTSITTHFAALTDPRVLRTRRHDLLDILTIARCAVICGADSWVEVERFGHAKASWFASFLALPNGIPCHDTFGRVFARLDPVELEQCFLAWVRSVTGELAAQVVAIDGKTLRRSHDRAHGKPAVHLVSAWATASRLVLGQVAVAAKSNEITAIPALLRLLDLHDCTVTIDAMGCQTAIARQIRAQGADYVLALKQNQPTLAAEVADCFALARGSGGADLAPAQYAVAQTVGKEHGRLELRRACTITDPEILAYRNPQGVWADLRSIGLIEAERRIDGKVTLETRYFLSSLSGEVQAFASAVRAHWGVENGLHWILDVAFREDESRVRVGHGAENLAILRHVALNLLRQEHTAKCGVKAKRLLCGWDESYLLKVLAA
jgi:predicted transposase YbfD/YdcC